MNDNHCNKTNRMRQRDYGHIAGEPKLFSRDIAARRACRFALWIACCTVLTLLNACTRDSFGPAPGPAEDETDLVTFEIRIPQNSAPESLTRAMSGAQEAQVQEVDILVFAPSGGNFLYRAAAKTITRNPEYSDSDYKFTAALEESAGCDIVLIANARTAVQSFLTAQGSTPFTKTALQAGVVLDNTGSYHDNSGRWDASTPALFPMWGERENLPIAKNAVIEGILLHRMVARINFNVAATNFELREVYLYNSVNKGSVVPNASGWDAAWKPADAQATDPATGKAVIPSLPAGWARTASPLIYTYAGGEVLDKSCLNEIYTFEAPAGDGSQGPDNTYLVIGGLYDGSTEVTYYRIDIAEKNNTGVYEYLPLLRNHTYEFTLNSVARRGYATAALAAEAGPENTEVVLVIQHDADLHYFVSDSHYYLGASQKVLRVPYSLSGNLQTLQIRTNYPHGWTVKVSGSETDPDVPCSWLMVTTSTPSTGQEMKIGMESNYTSNLRRGYLHVSAGVDMVITIEQQAQNLIELSVSPAGDVSIYGAYFDITATGLFLEDMYVRFRPKFDTQIHWSNTITRNNVTGIGTTFFILAPSLQDEELIWVFEYWDNFLSEWVIFHEFKQLSWDFKIEADFEQGALIPEKPNSSNWSRFWLTGTSWPQLYMRAVDKSTLEVISDITTVPSFETVNGYTPWPIILSVYAYDQWNDQPARTVEFQWSKDQQVWHTVATGTQKGYYRIDNIEHKIYHPGSTERNDISHDGARITMTISGDFPAGVVEARLGPSEVQVDRTGGDGISANTPTDLLCRYNRTMLPRNIPISYRIKVNNGWQPWAYEQSGTGNIRTYVQPSIRAEMPTTGRIIAMEDCLDELATDPHRVTFMSWATAMGIQHMYNNQVYYADVENRNYPTYGADYTSGSTQYKTSGCSLYYEGDDPNDPVRGRGNWYLWGDGKSELNGEGQFFTREPSAERNAALGLEVGTEYWTYGTGNVDYQVTVQIFEHRWGFAYKYKPLLQESYNVMRTRCVRYPSAGELSQIQNGYAPNVVTTF